MAGLYIHIPFCKKACHYCNFHFSTDRRLENDFVTALLKEAEIRQPYLSGQLVNTVYLGGGTPSLLGPDRLFTILSRLGSLYSMAPQTEITLEANPDDCSLADLQAWKEAGINRLSLGIQSFLDEDLKWMNRAHSARQALQSLEWATTLFADLSIDLIYGTPTLSDKQWMQNLDTFLQFRIPHLSCYALTVEEKTALAHFIATQKVNNIVQEDQARQFETGVKKLLAAGYEHYEISNFALPGHRSRHNSSYWSGESYLGLGPSAHSFNGKSRQWNIANTPLYIQHIQQEQIPAEIEQLSATQQLNEYIMTALRTQEGLDLEKLAARFGEQEKKDLLERALPYFQQKQLENTVAGFRLSAAGKLFADGIAADLFSDEPQPSH
ncbi:MAG: radical SAM family heme chaperone HemW [Chitinophagaceae bacterium]